MKIKHKLSVTTVKDRIHNSGLWGKVFIKKSCFFGVEIREKDFNGHKLIRIRL